MLIEAAAPIGGPGQPGVRKEKSPGDRRDGRHLRRAAVSSAWLITEKLFALAAGLGVSILLARHLGPAEFGSLHYALAYVAMLGALTSLGLGGGVVVRELVGQPHATGEILGTTIALRIVGGVASIGLALLLAFMAGLSERQLIFLTALALPLEAASTLRLFFEAQVAARQVALAAIAATAIGAVLRLAGIIYVMPLWFFAAVVPLQALVTGSALVWVSVRGVPAVRLHYSADRAKQLLKESWPLILSAAGAILYLKLDQFMLGEMIGMDAVGVYSVAARLSEVWYVLPTVIGTSIAPRLLELRASDRTAYELRFKQAFRYSFWLGVAVALCVSVVATPVIRFLYGSEFEEAGTMLTIHVWTCPAVFIGVVLQKWFLAEGLLLSSFWRHLLGAAVNVVLNLLLIPLYGGVGAAIATLVSYAVANLLACFMGRRTFTVGCWMLHAILTPQRMVSSRSNAAP
jgi:PST family polysaccharide transporter